MNPTVKISRDQVDSRPILAALVGLSNCSDFLSSKKIDGADVGPKIQIDPRIL